MSQEVFTYPHPFQLESGSYLPQLEVAYHTYGKINPEKNNVVWVCHALTANSDVMEWWPGLFGQDCLFNPEDYFIICANILGSCYGTTGPLSVNPETGQPYYQSFPLISIRDMVQVHELLRHHLNINQVHTIIGGSLGGQQALEWAIQKPQLFQNLVLLATNAFHSPWGIAFNEAQRMAIQADETFAQHTPAGGLNGLRAARAMALLSYRHYDAYGQTQQEHDIDKTDHYKASSYQQYQGDKLAKRFNAYAYFALTKSMDSHQAGRNRNSVEAALTQITARTLVIGINTDLLFPISEQQFLARHIKQAIYKEVASLYGHDGFLIETAKLSQLIEEFYGISVAK
ncbi:MAG: homoserine O-acetyltransferase [Cytophagales bacterium CG18_big_fil_WC_8_21_14_2_50_42_9]|nr:MAG: homoserine O-acetyltransferase [Cytophagales bacterium CG18_big_fil_WC_8_21_14_2_50_42_9]